MHKPKAGHLFEAEYQANSISSSSPRISRRTVLNGLGASLALPFWGSPFAKGAAFTLRRDIVPTVPQPIPTAVQTVATAALSDSAGVIPDYFMGLSYEKGDFVTESLFTSTDTALAGMFNRLGNGVLRIGGNSVDQTLWIPDGPGNTPGQVSQTDIDNLAGFLSLTRWKVLYGVSLATSTPALAAAEVAYAYAKLSDRLIGLEIGNEPDEYSLSYFPSGWNLTAFETLWQEFRSAILAVTPSAIITGPASAGNVTTWTAPFVMGPCGSLISLLTQHYYRGNGHSVNATAANLVSPDTTIIADCVALKSSIAAVKIPFRFSETNSYLFGGSPGVSNAYASALWVVDHLFSIALGGGSGVNMQGGDMADYTPIANSGSAIVEAMPEYYGLLLFSLVGRGTLLKTSLSTRNFNATIYAVRDAQGAISIVIVNKEVYQSLKITIDCGQEIQHGHLIELRGSSLNSMTGQTLQGGTVSTDGSITLDTSYAPENISSSWVTCYVPAISAVLLRVY